MVLSLLLRAAAYFDYQADCLDECINAGMDCTITEINKKNFPCECMDDRQVCIKQATDFTVCIMSNGTALGGAKIWNDFNDWAHPNHTTPSPFTTIKPGPNPPITTKTPNPNPTTPEPNPNRREKFFEVYSLTVTTIGFVVTLFVAGKWIRETIRERRYRTFQNEQPDDSEVETGPFGNPGYVAGNRSLDSPYRETVENREES